MHDKDAVKFDKAYLPLLGMATHHFHSEAQAMEFVRWVRRTTKNHARPPSIGVQFDVDQLDAFEGRMELATPWIVTVANW